jgi:hypothetical protein
MLHRINELLMFFINEGNTSFGHIQINWILSRKMIFLDEILVLWKIHEGIPVSS